MSDKHLLYNELARHQRFTWHYGHSARKMMLSDGDMFISTGVGASRDGATSFAPDALLDALASIEASRLKTFGARRIVKTLLDFACGVGAGAAGIAVGQGISTLGTATTIAIGAGVGVLLVGVLTLRSSYRAIWRYADFAESQAVVLAGAVVLASLVVARVTGALALEWATVLLVALLALVATAGVRQLRRWQVAALKRRPSAVPSNNPYRVLIVGAGEHGLSIGRELLEAEPAGLELVGFLDDDPAKIGAALASAPVLGPLDNVLQIAEQYAVSEVIVAMPDASPTVVRAFVRKVEDAGLRVRAIRGVARFVVGGELHQPGLATHSELLPEPTSVRAHRSPNARRVLVTGGAGYVGSHLTRMLLDQGYHVRVLDRLDYGRHGIEDLLNDPRFELVVGDICSIRDVSRALRGVDSVLALAAIVGDPACNLDPDETVNLNYAATKILVDACNFYAVPRLLFASSCSVYGASADESLLTERSRLNPVSLYARTRVLSENILFDRRGDVEPVVLRLSTVFGMSPRMRFDLVVNTLTARAVVDRKVHIFGGSQWRPHIHVRDVARAFVRALEAPANAVAGEIFNVGGEALNHRIYEIGEIVAAMVPGTEVVRDPEVGDTRDYRVSFDKIRSVLGFKPEWSVADGVRDIAAALQANGALRRYDDLMYHNVHALKQSLVHPRRRQGDFTLPARLVRA